jgi:1-deoxy-D-xylulose-5-phosphate synthase
VHPALEAAQELASQAVSAAVLNARFARPLDAERILSLVGRCGAVVTVEEHRGAGGFGSAVLELLSASAVNVPTHCLAVDKELVEHGETLESVGLSTGDIVESALQLVRARGGADGGG